MVIWSAFVFIAVKAVESHRQARPARRVARKLCDTCLHCFETLSDAIPDAIPDAIVAPGSRIAQSLLTPCSYTKPLLARSIGLGDPLCALRNRVILWRVVPCPCVPLRAPAC